MHCIRCGVTLSGDQEVYCESCRLLSKAGRPLPPSSHPVASGATDIVVCSYCGERNRLVPGRVRPRCGRCNTQLPSVESSATGLATKLSPTRVLPPPEWPEASELGSRVVSRELPPKRVLPPREWAERRSVRRRPKGIVHQRTNRLYWWSTAVLSVLMVLSGLGDLFRFQPFVEDLRRLGYPEYLLTILGIAKLLGVAALLYPGMPRLKEWAYAGFAFDLGGATISQLVSGSTVAQVLPPAVCGSLVALSYITYRATTRSTRLVRASTNAA